MFLEDDGYTLSGAVIKYESPEQILSINTESGFNPMDYITIDSKEYPIDYNKLIEEVKAAKEVFDFQMQNRERARDKRRNKERAQRSVKKKKKKEKHAKNKKNGKKSNKKWEKK